MRIDWMPIYDVIDETDEVKTILLERPDDFTWEEGSYTHMALEGFNAGEKPNRALIRHMSISTMPNEKYVGITTRIKEECSEFKSILRSMKKGDQIAIFKTISNVPLVREEKNIYLLSSGVGLATFRPLALDYLERPEGITKMHSLNIDSTKNYLFPTVFTSNEEKNFTCHFVDQRDTYYAEVKKLAQDQEAVFYIVGSDEFLKQNIGHLLAAGIQASQIKLDKREGQLADFFPVDVTQ